MDRRKQIALKLQMGINPSLKIEPALLRIMWRQLKLESVNAQRNRYNNMPQPDPVTTNPNIM